MVAAGRSSRICFGRARLLPSRGACIHPDFPARQGVQGRTLDFFCKAAASDEGPCLGVGGGWVAQSGCGDGGPAERRSRRLQADASRNQEHVEKRPRKSERAKTRKPTRITGTITARGRVEGDWPNPGDAVHPPFAFSPFRVFAVQTGKLKRHAIRVTSFVLFADFVVKWFQNPR